MHVHVANQRSHRVQVLFNRRLLERCDHHGSDAKLTHQAVDQRTALGMDGLGRLRQDPTLKCGVFQRMHRPGGSIAFPQFHDEVRIDTDVVGVISTQKNRCGYCGHLRLPLCLKLMQQIRTHRERCDQKWLPLNCPNSKHAELRNTDKCIIPRVNARRVIDKLCTRHWAILLRTRDTQQSARNSTVRPQVPTSISAVDCSSRAAA